MNIELLREELTLDEATDIINKFACARGARARDTYGSAYVPRESQALRRALFALACSSIRFSLASGAARLDSSSGSPSACPLAAAIL